MAHPSSSKPRLAGHVPPGRRLHLVDIENLAGGSDVDASGVARAFGAYRCVAPERAGDHVIVACGPRLAPVALFAAPSGARRLLGRGLDGADRALTEAAGAPRTIAASYEEVVIGSGDHWFGDLIVGLGALGCPVTIVAPAGRVAGALASAGARVVTIEVVGDNEDSRHNSPDTELQRHENPGFPTLPSRHRRSNGRRGATVR